MEGKELYNEDDENNPNSKKEEEADDFGLPDIEKSEENTEDLGEPFDENWEDKKEEETFDYTPAPDEAPVAGSDEYEPDYSANDEADDLGTDEGYRSSYYEEEYGQKKYPIGWIIFAVFVLIAIIIGVFWWLNRETTPEPVQTIKQPVVQQPIKEPEPEPEPVKVEPEPARQAGVYEINQPTGRYHVIVASSIDKDLVHDYAVKLAKQGMTCNILAPRGNRKFHRLSVADFVSLNDAALRAEQLKSKLGDDVWVIRY